MFTRYFFAALTLKLDKQAVTALEYALIASLIAVVIIAGVTSIGTKITVIFNKISTDL